MDENRLKKCECDDEVKVLDLWYDKETDKVKALLEDGVYFLNFAEDTWNKC